MQNLILFLVLGYASAWAGSLDIVRNGISFHPNGRIILVPEMNITYEHGAEGCCASVFDILSGKKILSLKGTSDEQIQTASFSPDGRFAIVGHALYETKDFSSPRILPIPPNYGFTIRQAVTQMRFSPDSSMIGSVFIADNHTTQAWFWDTLSGALKFILAHPDPVGFPYIRRVQYSGDSSRIFTFAFKDEVGSTSIDSWDAHTGYHLDSRLVDSTFTYISLSPDKSLLVTVDPKQVVTVQDFESGSIKFKQDDPSRQSVSASLSNDNRYLAVTSAYLDSSGHQAMYGKVELFEMRLPQPVRLWVGVHNNGHLLAGARNAAFSPDGNLLVVNFGFNRTSVFNVQSGKLLRSF